MSVTPTISHTLADRRDERLLPHTDSQAGVSHDPLKWEELHPWLLDSLQDLQHVSDLLVACLSEVDEPEEAAHFHYALWLNQTALASVEAVMDLLAFPNTFLPLFNDIEIDS